MFVGAGQPGAPACGLKAAANAKVAVRRPPYRDILRITMGVPRPMPVVLTLAWMQLACTVRAKGQSRQRGRADEGIRSESQSIATRSLSV